MTLDIINKYKQIKGINFSESLLIEEIRKLVDRKEPILFDIGANCGQTTSEFLTHMPGSKVFSFEPDDRAIQQFKALITSENVTLTEVAVGNINGTIMFHQSSGAEHIDPKGWNHSGSIRRPKTHLSVWPWVKFETTIPVPIVRLDDWAKRNGIMHVDFIWADVQGAEEDVICGAKELLNKTRFFYTEFSNDEWYEGQINFQKLCELLPNFTLLHKFTNDALFVSNTELLEIEQSQLITQIRTPMKPIIPPGNLRYEMFSKGIFLEQMVPMSRLQLLAKKFKPYLCGYPLIRLGAPKDGGYLVPEDLHGIKACFSPGVDTFATFETDLLKFGIGSHLADFSVEGVPDGLVALSFIKKFIGPNTEDHYISLQDWVSEHEPEARADELILQMDVEGAEYATILSCPEELIKKFRIMVIEFHDVETWGVNHFLNLVEATFNKLLRTHCVVHNHPNNAMGLVDMGGFAAPRVFELTFLSRTRASIGSAAPTPHPLDYQNVDYMPPLDLIDCWLPLSNNT